MNIPKQVSELAAKYGFNSVTPVKQATDETIYSVACVDEDGSPLPVGLPTFIVFDGNTCKLIDDEAGLTLSGSLFGNE